jgi:multidrug transporter EmrE-like cation transporter
MHALTILQRHLAPLLAGIHARRLAALLDAVAATVSGPRLTLTDIGRRFGGEATLRNRIKRSDRLLGNHHLQGQARTIYAALARKLLSGILEPLIVIDWSDLKADQSLHLLRAAIGITMLACFAYGLRTLPLSEAYAIFFVAPLLITLLAAPLLGEKVGANRWWAIAIGLVGVLVVLRPSGDQMLSLAGVGGELRSSTRTGAQPGGDGAASEGVAQFLRRQGMMTDGEWTALLRSRRGEK